jgi:hypothetical protein
VEIALSFLSLHKVPRRYLIPQRCSFLVRLAWHSLRGCVLISTPFTKCEYFMLACSVDSFWYQHTVTSQVLFAITFRIKTEINIRYRMSLLSSNCEANKRVLTQKVLFGLITWFVPGSVFTSNFRNVNQVHGITILLVANSWIFLGLLFVMFLEFVRCVMF